jgi:histidine triad (HIT) family protein
MNNCVFCKIVKKEIPADIVKMTRNLVVFKDANPKADVHLLIVPKKHIQDIGQAADGVWIEIKKVAATLAKERKLKGYRLVHNAGNAAAVPHMHVHFLGEVSVEREV